MQWAGPVQREMSTARGPKLKARERAVKSSGVRRADPIHAPARKGPERKAQWEQEPTARRRPIGRKRGREWQGEEGWVMGEVNVEPESEGL